MVRDERYKLVVYHGIATGGVETGDGEAAGELFDLQADPNEHDNRWADPALADVRFALLRRSFDATAMAIDTGPEVTQVF